MRGRGLVAGMVAVLAGTPGNAQETRREPLPEFDTCFAQAVANFEMDFARTGVARDVADYAIVTRDRVEFCGTLAIVACDRGEGAGATPQECQRALAEDQRALGARVLSSLPEPGAVPPDPVFGGGLYETLWGVARGASAGNDCAGQPEVMAAWCDTHQARLKLAEAVALWQVARLQGVAGPAVDLGWVARAMPFAPVPRPTREEAP